MKRMVVCGFGWKGLRWKVEGVLDSKLSSPCSLRSRYFHPGFRATPSREQDLTMIAVIPRTSRSITHLAKEVLDVVSCLLLERLGNDAMLADVCTAPAPSQVVYQWLCPVRSEPRCKSKFWQCQSGRAWDTAMMVCPYGPRVKTH